MTDTPYRDIALRAGCPWYTCDAPNCQPECNNYRISALEILRAAFPWDLPAERLEAMARAMYECGPMFKNTGLAWNTFPDYLADRRAVYIADAIAAYRADPLFKELWRERLDAERS